jgi:predicted permease
MSELRISLRRLRRSPGYLAAAVLSLAIGTAVCVAAFSLVDVMVFEDVPGIRDRRNLIRINWTTQGGLFTTAELDTLQQLHPPALASFAAQGDRGLPVLLPSGSTTLAVALVSARFFETLGTRAVVGRLLTAADADPGAPPAAVVADGLWRGPFNGAADIVGRSIVVGGRAFTIVGVMPARAPGLRLVDLGTQDAMLPQVWVGLHHAAGWRAAAVTAPWLTVAARLAPHATVRQARSQVNALTSRLNATAPVGAGRTADSHRSLVVFRGGLDWRDDAGQALLTLAVFLFVPASILAIGCINVMSLQLARGLEQSAELSVRLALGASRARLVRLMMLEVAAVSALSGLGGWIGARLLLARMAAYLPNEVPVDNRLFAGAALLVVLVVAGAGLGPAWMISREVVAAGLKSLDLGGSARARVRSTLLTLQIAASVLLLALSGLAIRSLAGRSPFLPDDASQILLMDVNLANIRPTDPRPGEFARALLDRLRDHGSIRAVGVATFGVAPHSVGYALPLDPPDTRRTAQGGFVTPQWFAATAATFLAGRAIDEPSGAPAQAVVNAAFAADLSADRATVPGSKIRRPDGTIVEIVGVVADTLRTGKGEPVPMLFLPMPPRPPSAFTVVAHAREVASARRAMASAVSAIDPLIPIGRIETLDTRTDASFKGLREMTTYGVALGALALGLAAAGLYSLLSYTVRRRSREIGIRLAIGASDRRVVWTVVKPAVWVLVAGATMGVAVAVPIATVLQAALLGLPSLDPLSLLGSLGVLALVTLAAIVPPVLRAARIDPVHALREL